MLRMGRWRQLVESGGAEAYRMAFNDRDELEFTLTAAARDAVLDHIAELILKRHLGHISKLRFGRPTASEWGFNNSGKWEDTPSGAKIYIPYPNGDLTNWKKWKGISHATLATIQIVVEALSFFEPTENQGEQIFHIQSVTNDFPYRLGALASASAGKVLREMSENPDEDVTEAMRRAYSHFAKGEMLNLESGIRMVYHQSGIPHFQAGGSCACFGLHGAAYDDRYSGFEFADHNLDNAAYLLVILAGLARLEEKIRSWKK